MKWSEENTICSVVSRDGVRREDTVRCSVGVWINRIFNLILKANII